MSIAALILRESATASLSSIVEKSQRKKPPFLEYELQLNVSQLDLIPQTKTQGSDPCVVKPISPDEGFESDVDSLSIVSSDESFTSNGNVKENVSPTGETDSANGSASSDSDTDSPSTEIPPKIISSCEEVTNSPNSVKSLDNFSFVKNVEKESYPLVDCLCYTNITYTEILIFIIRNEVFVFKFDNLNVLQNFYTNFTALKAVNNQILYNKTTKTKFNLLQTTDNNGITHIQITRDSSASDSVLSIEDQEQPTSIISFNTPEDNLNRLILDKLDLKESRYKHVNIGRESDHANHRYKINKSASVSDILSCTNLNEVNVNPVSSNTLRKVWTSADDLLDTPKRPERRKKSKAPLPPNVEIKQDILSGQYVRVNVNSSDIKESARIIIKSQAKEPHPNKFQHFLLSNKPTLNFLSKSKNNVFKPRNYELVPFTKNKSITGVSSNWTNSVPRLVKPRSRSETRTYTPMAYRYIDTDLNFNSSNHSTSHKSHMTYRYPTGHMTPSNGHMTVKNTHIKSTNNGSYQKYSSNTINNRLFGMSSKLREFGSQNWDSNHNNEGCEKNLKSVIKKDENTKRKIDKKVTFSDFTTVQVV